MSFRGYIFAILLILGVAYLWLETDPNLKSASRNPRAASRQASKPVELKAFSTVQKNSESTTPQEDDISYENRCWEKINSQARETDDFRFRMESRLGSLALALEYLEEAASLDPTNSAPMIYAAMVASRLGLTSKSDLYYRLALDRGERFDSYIKKFTNEVYATVENADDYIAAASILAKVPMPEYSELKSYLQAPGGKKLAIQMLQDGLRQQDPVDMVDYLPLEYAIGRSVIGDDPKYPTLKQLWDRHPASAESDEIAMALHKNCDISSLEPAVIRLKDRLSARYKAE